MNGVVENLAEKNYRSHAKPPRHPKEIAAIPRAVEPLIISCSLLSLDLR